MYIPASFRETDTATLHEFVRAHSFALLVSQGAGGLIASHLPLLLDVDADGDADAGPHGRLLGHMARANPQWKAIEGETLAVFSGPHAYISPSWYETPGTVPTWNYAAVHVYGTLRIVEDRAGLLDILARSVATYESGRPDPWPFDPTGPEVEAMLKAIVGFRIAIQRIEGKWKLNQNHPEERRRKVIRALETRPDADSQAIARLMTDALSRPRLP